LADLADLVVNPAVKGARIQVWQQTCRGGLLILLRHESVDSHVNRAIQWPNHDIFRSNTGETIHIHQRLRIRSQESVAWGSLCRPVARFGLRQQRCPWRPDNSAPVNTVRWVGMLRCDETISEAVTEGWKTRHNRSPEQIGVCRAASLRCSVHLCDHATSDRPIRNAVFPTSARQTIKGTWLALSRLHTYPML
jgi:hypothetical protein